MRIASTAAGAGAAGADATAAAAVAAASAVDAKGRTPLHTLCANPMRADDTAVTANAWR